MTDGGLADLPAVAGRLVEAFEARVTADDGRIRVEDLLSLAGAVCGEACIAAAGEVDPERHDLTPGAPVLSDRVNGILCRDAADWDDVGESVFGVIRAGALAQGYEASDFPSVSAAILQFIDAVGAAGAAGPAAQGGLGWGFVRLSVPEAHWPRVQPLRDAYELRTTVRHVLSEGGVAVDDWPAACALAIVIELARVRKAIDRGVAVRLVLETVNGMAKTAPMTERHLKELLA